MRVLISSNPDPSWSRSTLIHQQRLIHPDPPWSIPDPSKFYKPKVLNLKIFRFFRFFRISLFCNHIRVICMYTSINTSNSIFFSRLTWKLQGYNEMRENFIVVMFKQYYTTSKAPLQGVKELGSPPPRPSPDPFATRSLLILVLLHSLIHLSPPLSCWSTALS